MIQVEESETTANPASGGESAPRRPRRMISTPLTDLPDRKSAGVDWELHL